ncbi:MAG: hypothetical protein JSU87_02905 [Gemmatimonadota bacterium]|nr:MAG: hypothetical protein JSU87_02905 [Gemmatimonadota bacterium]
MSKRDTQADKTRIRELAQRTLEAYRKLNSAAAEAAFSRSRKNEAEDLTRAGELLEAVVADLKGAA